MELNIIHPEEIRMDQSPRGYPDGKLVSQFRWKLVPLYKLLATGDIIFWQIGYNGGSYLETQCEYNDGTIILDKIDLISRGNLQEDALREARKQYKIKYYEGYQPAGDINPPLVKAMKGYEYKDGSIKNWPVYTQPKLHGIKMMCQDLGKVSGMSGKTATGRIISMRSWLNNPFTHLTHIEMELYEFFPYLPRNATLDGELYNHGMDFSTLTSAVKTVKTVHQRLHDVQFWICDISYEDQDGAPFERRCALLINAFRRYIQDRSTIGNPDDLSVLPKTFRIVPTLVARSHDEIIQQHNKHVESGYEGIMIKKISNGHAPGSKVYNDSLYKSGKSNHILKYKQFTDEEAIILNVKYHDQELVDFTVQDRRENIFDVRMRVKILKYFSNKSYQYTIIGKELTIRYNEISDSGIPHNPIGIAIRDYE
jgi:hypothetical protein